MQLIVYGSSDDLVLLKGCVDGELDVYSEEGVTVNVNGEQVATLAYGRDDRWKSTLAARPPAGCTVTVEPAVADEGNRPGTRYPAYSDVVTVTGTIGTVTITGSDWPDGLVFPAT